MGFIFGYIIHSLLSDPSPRVRLMKGNTPQARIYNRVVTYSPYEGLFNWLFGKEEWDTNEATKGDQPDTSSTPPSNH